MTMPYIGEIRILPYTYAPRNWAYCDGQIIETSQNPTLFAVINNWYGGNGVSNFGLPDLKMRAPMGKGTGPGLPPVTLAQWGGSTASSLAEAQLPNHDHTAYGSLEWASNSVPSNGHFLAGLRGDKAIKAYHAPDAAVAKMSSDFLATSGGSQDHENRQPLLAVNFCICLNGIFPPRN